MLNDLHGKLQNIYSPTHFSGIASTCNIHESEQQATVTDINISTSGRLFEVSNSFQKALQRLYNNSQQCTVLTCDCDGVLMAELDGQHYVIFVELKSSYTKKHIGKAQKQLLTGYFNILTHLNIVDGFDPTQWKYCSIIASHPIKTEDVRLYQQWQQQNSLKDCYCEKALFFAMHKEQPSTVKIDEVSEIVPLPIKSPFLCGEMPLFHLDVPANSSSATFNIDSLLRTL